MIKTYATSATTETPPYGDANTPMGPLPLSLDLRFRNGNRHAFSYAFLFEVDYDASGTIRLIFGGNLVEIRGRNLAELYEQLLRHGVGYIQESVTSSPALGPHVESIQVETTAGGALTAN
jgi:hypothetical protein